MPDDIPEEVTEEVVPEVPVVEPPAPVPAEEPWMRPINELRDTVNEISDKLATILNPPEPEVITEVVADETPTKKPWTHRAPWQRD